MTIIEKIKQSIEGATGLPFLYHAAGELNELIARCKSLPVAYSFLIDSGTIDDVNGRYHERVTLAVMFCDKTEFDFNALENEQIIERMKVKAYKWLQSLRMSNTLRIVSINNTQRLYDNTTDVLTGFAVNITIDDIAGVGECELPQVVIDVDKNGNYDVVGVDKVRVNVVPNLEELEVTQNGEFLPSKGVDGFSKVTANVVPQYRIKTAGISTNASIIDDDGWWRGAEYLDTSLWTRSCSFTNFKSLKKLNVSNWDTRNWRSIRQMFQNCISLEYVDVSNWNTSNIIDNGFQLSFSDCRSLSMLDVTNWDASNATSVVSMFASCKSLQSLIGNRTIEDVLENNITALNGLKVSLGLKGTILDRASIRAVINGLADLTGQTAQTLTLDAALMAKLTEEDIAIAVNKNWTIV